MREVIDEILGTEKDAERILAEARKAAEDLKTAADTEAAGIVASAREDAQTILRDETQRAREQARAAHDALVRKAEEENRRFLERQEGNLSQLVDRVVDLLRTPEHAKR